MGCIYRGFPWLPTGISMVSWGVDRHTVWEGNSKSHGRCRTPNHCLGLKHFKLINTCVLSWWHCDRLLYLCMYVRMRVCVCVCARGFQWIVVISLCVLVSLYVMFSQTCRYIQTKSRSMWMPHLHLIIQSHHPTLVSRQSSDRKFEAASKSNSRNISSFHHTVGQEGDWRRISNIVSIHFGLSDFSGK